MILVVDDDYDAGDLLVRLLKRVGQSAEHVTRADEALEFLRALRPSAIVLDLRMPGQDGLQLLKALRAEGAAADVPVLFYSAEAGEAPRAEAERLDARAWVVKGSGGWPELVGRILEIVEPATSREHDFAPAELAAPADVTADNRSHAGA